MATQIGNTTVYSAAEVATVVSKHRNTVLHHINNGILHGEKVNEGYVVDRAELERYVKERFKMPKEIIDLKLDPTPAT